MDAFYEESAVNNNAKSGSRKYKITHVFSIVALILAILFLMIFLMYMPWGISSGATAEQQAMYQATRSMCIFLGIQGVFMLGLWFFLYKLKGRFNVSYDYVFVTGELRISKVFNVNRRKLVARLDCEDMIQVGDIDNSSYERFRADPTVKEVLCTSNVEAAEGKFFMYVLANNDGKKLYVLECREQLLINIMKFAKRGTLESDYVMQEKKQR
jgi:hypothetical protein